MRKTITAVLLTLGGAAVFVLGSPYFTVFPTNRNQAYLVFITLFFLLLNLGFKRKPNLARYAPSAYALFIAAMATLFLNTGVLNLQITPTDPVMDLALDKLGQFLHIVGAILVLTLLNREELPSIFIQRGNLKRGLIFGLASFIGFAILALLLVPDLGHLLLSRRSALPWALAWIFVNSTMEELWFRGIFLRKYSDLIGRSGAILVTALIFGISHINATYAFPGGGYVFGAVVFGLGAIGAHAMLKDDSLIGPVLFHAGYDLIVIISVLNST